MEPAAVCVLAAVQGAAAVRVAALAVRVTVMAVLAVVNQFALAAVRASASEPAIVHVPAPAGASAEAVLASVSAVVIRADLDVAEAVPPVAAGHAPLTAVLNLKAIRVVIAIAAQDAPAVVRDAWERARATAMDAMDVRDSVQILVTVRALEHAVVSA